MTTSIMNSSSTPSVLPMMQDVPSASAQCGSNDTRQSCERRTSTSTSSPDDVPEEFLCPLTLEVMNDPLMDRSGMNFERLAIMEWLNRGNDSCPLTRKPLSYSKLVPNAQLRLKIDQWKEKNGIPVDRKEVPKKIQNMGGTFDAPAKTIHRIYEQQPSSLRQQYTVLDAVAADASRQGRQHQRRLLSFPRMQRRRGSVTAAAPESSANRRRTMVGILDSALSVVRSNHD